MPIKGNLPKEDFDKWFNLATSFPGSLFSASIVVEKRPWFTLVTCLPESGRFTKCVLGDGWQCRPCRHCEEGNQHAIDFVARWPSTKCLTAVFYELYTWNSTWKAKSCGQTDRTPQKITSRYSSFHPCEEPDQRRMLIVCDNFKGKKILSCKKTSETFIHGKQTCSAINRCVVI